MANFADRLVEVVARIGTPACVGIDPRLELIPEPIRAAAYDAFGHTLEGAADALKTFGKEVVDVVADRVAVVKLQVAFYERFGGPGMAAFAHTLAYAQGRGLLTIADVKRGDVPDSAEAYAEAYFGGVRVDGEAHPVCPADAVTLSPYLGWDSVRPFIDRGAPEGRGVFLLVRTSNKSAPDLQDLPSGDSKLFVRLAEKVGGWGEAYMGACGYGAVGAVVGATYPAEAALLRKLLPRTYFLVPGYGMQGGTGQDVAVCFDARGLGALVNSSRRVSHAYEFSPWKQLFGAQRWKDAVRASLEQMIGELRECLRKA